MFCTFYSFRGGHGQSVALCNIAVALAARGLRVIVMEMAQANPSLVPLMGLSSGRRYGLSQSIQAFVSGGEPLPLERMLVPVSLPQEISGEIHLLPLGESGGDSPGPPWKTLYDQHEGYAFIENLLSEIRQQYAPDLVLVDAGAGLGAASAIAVLQIADALVLFSGAGELDLEILEQGASRLAAVSTPHRPRERLVVLSPLPASAGRTGEERLRKARDFVQASDVVGVPWCPTLALKSDSRLAFAQPEEPASEAFWRIASWLDGSGLLPSQFKTRTETLIQRPECLLLLQRHIEHPGATVLDAFRDACVEAPTPAGATMAARVVNSKLPYLWRAAAAQALVEVGAQAAATQDELPGDLVLAQMRHLQRTSLAVEREIDLLVGLSSRLACRGGAVAALEAVQSLLLRSPGMPIDSLLGVFKQVFSTAPPEVSVRALNIAGRLPARSLGKLAPLVTELVRVDGLDAELLAQLLGRAATVEPEVVTPALIDLWMDQNQDNLPCRPALASLRVALGAAPGPVARALVERSTERLIRDFHPGGPDPLEKALIWYMQAPAHPAVALLTLVEDAMTQWLATDPRKGSAIAQCLVALPGSIPRWMLLGALPRLKSPLRRTVIRTVSGGFYFPPRGGERRWESAGVAWVAGQGPWAPACDPLEDGLLVEMVRGHNHTPSSAEAQVIFAMLERLPQLHTDVRAAALQFALRSQDRLPEALITQAQEELGAAPRSLWTVAAWVELLHHPGARGQRVALLQDLADGPAGATVVPMLTRIHALDQRAARSLASRLLAQAPQDEMWPGLLRYALLLDQDANSVVLRLLSWLNAGGLPTSLTSTEGRALLRGVVVSALVSPAREVRNRALKFVARADLPRTQARALCTELAQRALTHPEAMELLTRLLRDPRLLVRDLAAGALLGVLNHTAPAEIPDSAELISSLASELQNQNMCLDSVRCLLTLLANRPPDSSGLLMKLIRNVMDPSKPALGEEDLIELALLALSRVIRSTRGENEVHDAARRMYDSLRRDPLRTA